MNNKLDIFTLGKFQVLKGETVITEKKQAANKIWDLFQYLVSTPDKETPIEIIIEEINLSLELRDAKNALENTIYRLRKLLASNEEYEPGKYIFYNRGSYGLNLDADIYLDFLEFKNCFQQGEKYYKSGEYQTALQHFYKCFDLYNGEFIPENSKITRILQQRHYYRKLFLEQGSKTCDILLNEQDYKQLEEICYKILQIEPFEEKFHIKLIEAFINRDQIENARNHFDYTKTLFKKSTKDLSPEFYNILKSYQNKETKNSYDNQRRDSNIDEIYSKINTKNNNNIVFLTPETFKELVTLEIRKKDRTNKSTYLISLNFNVEEFNKSRDEEKITKDIKHIFSQTIKKSDIISNWNNHHYLLLITVYNEKKVNKIIKKIRQAFNTLDISSEITLNTDFKLL